MRILLALVAILTLLIYWASNLSLFPLPWPDDPAFFLAGIDLATWPPQFLMRSQSHYLPSYAHANFQLMPGFPSLMAASQILGIVGNHGIKIWGFLFLGFYLYLLARFALRLGLSKRWVWAIVLCALFSPQLRWSAGVVRPEVLEGALWLAILHQLSSDKIDRARLWDISGLLALAAWFHFNAIVWVLPVALGLFPWEQTSRRALAWTGRLWAVGWRVALYLSPWAIYAYAKQEDFLIQMEAQFGRLTGTHPFITSVRSFMDSVFLSVGNPVEYPKFFNPAKILFWVLLTGTTLFAARQVFSGSEPPARKRLIVAASTAVLTTLALWVIKYEIWFSPLVHYAFYPMLALAASSLSVWRIPLRARTAFLSTIAILAAFHLSTTFWQWKTTRESVNWSAHQAWSDCIGRVIDQNHAYVIWQPHWPDVLVNLASKNPDREYYRTVDYYNVGGLLDRFSKRTDAVIHTLFLAHNDPEAQSKYEGPLRPGDRKLIENHPWLAYREYSALKSKDRDQITVCQEGPFWAAVSYRNR